MIKNELVIFLEKHKISQSRFSKVSGYSQSSVNDYCLGKARISKSLKVFLRYIEDYYNTHDKFIEL